MCLSLVLSRSATGVKYDVDQRRVKCVQENGTRTLVPVRPKGSRPVAGKDYRNLAKKLKWLAEKQAYFAFLPTYE